MTNRIVLGLGGTVDYEISWDSAVLEELVRRGWQRATTA